MENEITITKEHLDSVVADAVKKALAGRGTQEKPKRVTERFAKVRFYKDKLVRKYDNVSERRNDMGRLVAYMDITLDGVEAPERVEYLNFLDKTRQYNALIKKVHYEEQVIIEDPNHTGGTFKTVNSDEAGIERKNFQPIIVDAEVTKKVKTSDIEILDGPYAGQTFTVIDNDCLNQ